MISTTVIRHLLLSFCLSLFATMSHASVHWLDKGNSAITISFKQLGRELSAQFHRFNAAIEFNEHHIEQARVYIDLDVTSIDTGYPDYNQEILTPDWLNAEQFPVATLSSLVFIPRGIPADGMLYDVAGTLIIKGHDEHVLFPLSVTRDNNHYTFSGTMPIKRLAYNIGENVWHGTDMIADDVVIQFHLKTTSPTTNTQ
jgi:polyisoprenoid-binding protein YceI